MLGARTSPAMKRPAVLKADVISWEAEVNEEMKLQKQVKEGPVRYPFGDPDAEYILLQAGTAFTEHTGWFDSSGKLVPEGDAQAVRSAKMGGPAYLQIREVGKEGSEKWVTKGHVQALSFGKRQCLAEELGAREGSSSADRSGAGEGGSGDQLEEEGGEEEITREALRTAVMGVAAAAEPPCPRSLALRLVRGRRRAMAMASWPPRSSPGWGAVVRRSG